MLNAKDIVSFDHPFHTHGGPCQVVDVGTAAQLASGGNPAYINSDKNAPMKDTFAVPSGRYQIYEASTRCHKRHLSLLYSITNHYILHSS